MPHTTDIINPKTSGTIAGLFIERVRRTPQAHAYQRYCTKDQRFEAITWQETFSLAGRWQAAFEQEGLQVGDRVAIILRNCLEWVLFDLAASGLGLVTVPLFADDRASNINHILKETAARLVLASDRDRWLRIENSGDRLTGIERVLILNHDIQDPDQQDHTSKFRTPPDLQKDSIDAGSVNNSGRNPGHREAISTLAAWLPDIKREYTNKHSDPDALATIVYTSGTTGVPKGVMLSHANILEDGFACLRRIPIYSEDLFLSFLPLSHTFERTVGYYVPMMAGACVAYVRSIDKLPEDLREVRPTVLIAVPRIYERVHAKIKTELRNKPAISRNLFRLTVHTGWQRFLYTQGRLEWTPLFLLWPILEKIVAKRLTQAFGGRLRLSISGGAPIGLSVARVFIGLGLNFLQGYGLTETSPVLSVNTTRDNNPSTVGRPLPGVETLIAQNGELLVRGPNVMLGYWQNREATASVIDSEGYFYTGDIAEVDADGYLKIVGRIKEIIVLSTGKKIPPGDLELTIAENPLFDQVMIVGEGRSYLAALVVLNGPEWEKLAGARNLSADQPDILSDKQTKKILLSEIARMMHRFPEYAQIRQIHATLSPWRMQDGLITNTLKLRRKEILKRFAPEVDSLFQGD